MRNDEKIKYIRAYCKPRRLLFLAEKGVKTENGYLSYKFVVAGDKDFIILDNLDINESVRACDYGAIEIAIRLKGYTPSILTRFERMK